MGALYNWKGSERRLGRAGVKDAFLSQNESLTPLSRRKWVGRNELSYYFVLPSGLGSDMISGNGLWGLTCSYWGAQSAPKEGNANQGNWQGMTLSSPQSLRSFSSSPLSSLDGFLPFHSVTLRHLKAQSPLSLAQSDEVGTRKESWRMISLNLENHISSAHMEVLI